MSTDRQILANQRNAQKSTGPTTESGKEASRRNAVKHGLSGSGIVLPEAEEAAVADRLAQWGPRYGDLAPHQAWAFEEMVRESVRIDRCNREELALRARSVERAETTWNDDCRVAAETLGQRLHAKPSLVARQLEMSLHGCEWKVERWESLAAVLIAGADWDERHRSLAQDLLGVIEMFRDIPCAIDLEKDSEDSTMLRSHRLSVIAMEVSRLRELAEGSLAFLDEADRTRVAAGLEIEPDRALARINRYSNACHRRFQAAAKLLKAAQAPAPPTSKALQTVSSSLPQVKVEPSAPPVPSRLEVARKPRPLNRRQRRAMASQQRAVAG